MTNLGNRSMSQTNYDIALYNSPYFENLVSEFYRIGRYKRNIYRKIRNEQEYNNKLSFEERMILKDLSEKENKILLEILVNKNWLNLSDESFGDCMEKLIGEYKLKCSEEDKYDPDFGA
jgi:hypothetical protein